MEKTYSTLFIHPPKRRRCEKFLTELVLDRIFVVSVGNSNLNSDLRSRAKFEFPTSTANIPSQHRSVIYITACRSISSLLARVFGKYRRTAAAYVESIWEKDWTVVILFSLTFFSPASGGK